MIDRRVGCGFDCWLAKHPKIVGTATGRAKSFSEIRSGGHMVAIIICSGSRAVVTKASMIAFTIPGISSHIKDSYLRLASSVLLAVFAHFLPLSW